MNALYALIMVLALVIIPLLGAGAAGWHVLFGVIVPYLAFIAFVLGFIYRVVLWGRSAVPFKIPTTAGQQQSFPWIRRSRIDNPSTRAGVVVRMILEVLLFRSLFRNARVRLFREGPQLSYGSSKFLWLGALAFHVSFFVILARHMRFFTEPVPVLFNWMETLDGIMQVGVPTLFATEIVILLALAYLLLRRLIDSKLRYISLPTDYFALFLLFAIVISGVLMRYFLRVDIVDIKTLSMGLIQLQPEVPDSVGVMFYTHLFLVCSLLVYFPWSKLMHLAGVFFSPTRNLPNDNRMRRHVNPWNYPVKVHTYEEWENEYRDKLKEAGIPVEKE
ncbi:MAG: sulfate reduction electron transfer complex DsrMKJOP subunit DsrM [Desulfohalobiaceae bacterium]|nr:sulfate reduction electron transfer complex DsrMKJOP subunit DsrM [Desulfohalobiaceae bacterium]